MTTNTPKPKPDTGQHFGDPAATSAELQNRYQQLRSELEQRLAEPVPNLVRADELVDLLEQTQLALKERHGVHGNNPNE